MKYISELKADLDEIEKGATWTRRSRRYGKRALNVPVAFDIETTSFIDTNGEKVALMYEWTFGIKVKETDYVYYGRTWDEFLSTCKLLEEVFVTDTKNVLVIYVHNLAFEFQFIRKLFTWAKVFATDTRKVLYALTDTGLEFRCSYLLSGQSLSNVGKNLKHHDVKKLSGDLDYRVIRTPLTPLTTTELGYCENDVRVVLAYIAEVLEDDDLISVPYTNTGYVRRFVRNYCFYNNGQRKYHGLNRLIYRKFIKNLTLQPDEFMSLRRAFAGGFTHAGALHCGVTLHNVQSHDETSAYPTVMVSEKFPMSAGKKVEVHSVEELEEYMKYYAVLFDIRFEDLDTSFLPEQPLSRSKCYNISDDRVINNGRVVSASYAETTITDVDYQVLKQFYRWSSIQVRNVYIYERAYLPRDFIMALLDLYVKKTELKGIPEEASNYDHAKRMFNACYGMTVTNIIKDDNVYDNDTSEWQVKEVDIKKKIKRYNSDPQRFLFYPWGVWITAYARRNLFLAIKEFGRDYCYADTDSIKSINTEKHLAWFDAYNRHITAKINACLRFHGIPDNLASPKSKDGRTHNLGWWDDDGTYDTFKTLGAKRYLVLEDGKLKLTMAGVRKSVGDWMQKKFGDKVFDAFTEDLVIPKGYCGKLTHTYVDAEMSGTVVDKDGRPYNYVAPSGVHLEESEYRLSIPSEYINYLLGLEEVYE